MWFLQQTSSYLLMSERLLNEPKHWGHEGNRYHPAS